MQNHQTRNRNALLISRELPATATRLAACVFDYRRVGFDRRHLTFLIGGRIGQGARERELFWKLSPKGKKVILEIRSAKEPTCQLVEGADRVWRGRWLCGERMPIELAPVPRWNESASSDDVAREKMPDSLFLISLPRSLSTMIYHCSRMMLGLHDPSWTSDGEILNLDRFALYQGRTHDANQKFIHPDLGPKLFSAATEFLDETVSPCGYAYKDVVQPFVVAEWIRRRGIRAIRIRRNIADVAYAMLRHRWVYPARLFPKLKNREIALVRGLIEAERALASISAPCLDFDDLIQDEKPLSRALEKLYPSTKLKAVSFIDNRFKHLRKDILARRNTTEHKKLSDWAAKYSEKEAALG